MVATPHALAGAFVARFARTPRGALAAGVISHLALDRIPHTDYRLANRRALVADVAGAMLVSAVLARRTGSPGREPSAASCLTWSWWPSCAPGCG